MLNPVFKLILTIVAIICLIILVVGSTGCTTDFTPEDLIPDETHLFFSVGQGEISGRTTTPQFTGRPSVSRTDYDTDNIGVTVGWTWYSKKPERNIPIVTSHTHPTSHKHGDPNEDHQRKTDEFP